MYLKLIIMKLILLLFLFSFNLLKAQFDVPLALYKQFNGKYGYKIIGNTHNNTDIITATTAQCQMLTSSSATLNLSPSQSIAGAYLYWSGIGNGTLSSGPTLNGIQIIGHSNNIANITNALLPTLFFSSYKEITSMFQQTGNGMYTFSNFDLNAIIDLYCSNGISYSGWNIIVVYEDLALQPQQLNIYNGFKYCGVDGLSSINVPINNLNVISNQDAKMSYIVWKGSSNLFLSESIQLNGSNLSNNLNPTNNPFNSTNSFTNSITNWNQDIDTFDVSPFINVGDTEANITFNSFFLRFLQTVVTSLRSELPDATVQQTQVSGQATCGNRNLQINYTVQNTNSNGNLPSNIPVSFYANNVLLSTVLTPTPIAIGGVLPLQTTVTVPLSVSNTFNLRVVVDNAVATSSTIAESNEGNNESVQSITLLPATLLPSFNIQNLFCAGAVAPVLPTVSSNGVSGSWSPSVINNQTGGNYLFTPTSAQGLCAAGFSLDVVVTPLVAPVFSLPVSVCTGATVPILPTVSNNGITGNWSPSVIDNQTSLNYVFTPATAGTPSGQCAASSTLNVTVTPNVNSVFSLPNSLCAGAAVPVLPTTSNNGIVGTWSPSVINNQNGGNYVFTPATAGTPNQCGLSFTQNINITPNAMPTFSLPDRFCQGAILPNLPTTSNNGISGSWSPSVINNQSSGNYVFAPTSGQCALSFTLNTIVEIPSPTAASLTICNDNQGNIVNPIDLVSGLNPNNFSFTWTKDNVALIQNTTAISVAIAGNYQLVATATALGCVQTFNFNVSVLQPISAIYIVSDDFALNQTISVQASGGSGQYQYSFNNLPYQNNAVFTVSNGGDIDIKVIDNADCTEFEKTITMWQYPRFFTPNNDSYNDTWTINTTKKISINIFDRFGRLLKQLKTGESWNGTFDSQPNPADDYWFTVQYDDNKTFKGHFSLKR